MYHVVVRIEARPDKIQQLLDLASYNSGCSRKEPGNLRFDVMRQVDQPLKIALYEVYQDEAAFKAHQQTAHYARWKAEVEQYQAGARMSDKYTTVAPNPYD